MRLDDFSSRDAVEAWVHIQEKLADDDLREPIVAGFREFCQDYETLVGERYEQTRQAQRVPGRLHLYEQAPRDTSRGAVHHLGARTAPGRRRHARGAEGPGALADLEYVLAGAPDGVLVEVFSPRPDAVPAELAGFFDLVPRPGPCP